jgi:hypothetical protein
VTDLPPSLRRYGRQLERAVAADLARRRLRLRVGAVAAALALIVVVLNVLPGGDDRAVAPASAVERAAEALAPPRGQTILHIRMLGRQFEDGRPDIHWENETWIGPGASRTIDRSPEGRVAETEHAGGFDRLWDPDRGRVVEMRSAEPGSLYAPDEKFRDEALAMLRSGQARVAGHERVGRRDALEIVAQGGAQTFLVDARDYTPIELRTRGTGGGTVLRFAVYERLPVDDASRRLLSISAAHVGAPVVRSADAYRAALARLFPNG